MSQEPLSSVTSRRSPTTSSADLQSEPNIKIHVAEFPVSR